ncbi:hypothetical protein HY947_00410 [Candidatus Gottesmanbacteria bacterium]|nr:hypothetical protein [Candidatus Gottesmanbacteria bacterium]
MGYYVSWIKGLIKDRVGLFVIIVLLLVISIFSLKPGLYLIGWDNYSSYLGGTNSLFRTLFSTWRGYRGIGVPSDSESVDVARQGLLLLISPFVSEGFLDQIYILACLWIGVLAMYGVVSRMLSRFEMKSWITDLASTVAAGAYLLNLNTIATFYFPIVTYITRYASLPFLVYTFDRCLGKKNSPHISDIGIFIVSVIFSLGSYITATVFITTLVLLFFCIIFYRQPKRTFLLFFIFFGLNSFWLLPFANYTKEKSQSLRFAPVFVDVNESQLNLPPSSFSLDRELLMYPNFFDTRVSAIDKKISMAFHPLADRLQHPMESIIVWLLPIASLLGLIVVIIDSRFRKKFLWVPIVYCLFLLFATQEYSPFGFVSSFFNTYIPYFSIVFRFGDTKFHPYMNLTGAILAGFSVLGFMSVTKRMSIGKNIIISFTLCSLLIVPLGIVYRDFVLGDFLPSYLFTVLPKEYKEVAAVLNSDVDEGRLLHLPYDPALYWRSHTWGYFGSAFFQYLLHRPYMDKTFEPASEEMSDFYTRLSYEIRDAGKLSGTALKKRSDEVKKTFLDAGISWILYDESVAASMPVKDTQYWGNYNSFDSKTILDALEESHMIQKRGEWSIDTLDARNLYESKLGLFPSNHIGKLSKLILYYIPSAPRVVDFLSSTTSIDPTLFHSFVANVDSHFVQDSSVYDKNIFPFAHSDGTIVEKESDIVFTLPKQVSSDTQKAIVHIDEASTSAAHIVSVSVQKNAESLEIKVYQVVLPEVNEKGKRILAGDMMVPWSSVSQFFLHPMEPDNFRSNWWMLGDQKLSSLRINIDNTILPIPMVFDGKEQSIGTVLVTHRKPEMSLLAPGKEISLQPESFHLTDEPNCYSDKIDGYTYAFDTSIGITLDSKNGSTCAVSMLSSAFNTIPHAEFSVEYEASEYGLRDDEPANGVSSKPSVTSYISKLPKPNKLSLCIKDASIDTCANIHQVVLLGEKGTLIFPTERTMIGMSQPVILFGLIPTGKQSQHISIQKISATPFSVVNSIKLTLEDGVYEQDVELSHPLTVKMPKVLSRGSYYWNALRDGAFMTNQPCVNNKTYRTTRLFTLGQIYSIENCSIDVFLKLSFDSSLMRLWTGSYLLHSGKYPKFLLSDNFANYIDEYISLEQGYPSVSGFSKFQLPEQWYRQYSREYIEKVFEEAPVLAYTWIRPRPENEDTRDKQFAFHQDSQNEGITSLSSQSIIELPSSWKTLRIALGNPVYKFGTAQVTSITKILPSVWRVGADSFDNTDQYMLIQREGYDRQWQLFTNKRDAIIGINGVSSVRCDGIYNCYKAPRSTAYYLVYAPERYALIGWLITCMTLATSLFIFFRRSQAVS